MTSQTSPLAMQVVAHDAPTRTPEHLAAAVAAAVANHLYSLPAELLADVDAWARTGSRKVVRHARGSRWDRAVEGAAGFHTADVFDGIAIRVLSPAPIDNLPAGIRRCQVSGHKVDLDAPAVPPGHYTIHVVLNEDLEMSPGKGAAAAAHVAQAALSHLSPEAAKLWASDDFSVQVTTGPLPADPTVAIADNGHTEVAPGSITAALPVLPSWAGMASSSGA